MDEREGTVSFLKRGFRPTNEGDVESERIRRRYRVQRTSGRSFQAQKNGMTPLRAEKHHIFRKGVRLITAPERPDAMYMRKKLSTKLAGPTQSDMEILKQVGKYLKGTSDVALIHKHSFPGRSFLTEKSHEIHGFNERNPHGQQSVLEAISDSDWAADRENRQSASCGAIMLNGNLIHFQFKRQKCVALSSCAVETIAATSMMSEAVFLKGLLTSVLGQEPRMILYSDSSSSRQLIARNGLGKARHLDIDYRGLKDL